MKKLIVLLLVLGIATSASAALTATVTDPVILTTTTVTMDLAGAGASPDPYLAITIQQGSAGSVGTLSSFADVTGSGNDLAGVSVGTTESFSMGIGQGEVWSFTDSALPYEYPDGSWLSASISSQVVGNVIGVYQVYGDLTYTLLDSVVVTPEPMTIALLGLGGLFLRRRK